jgi:hypothetical protein
VILLRIEVRNLSKLVGPVVIDRNSQRGRRSRPPRQTGGRIGTLSYKEHVTFLVNVDSRFAVNLLRYVVHVAEYKLLLLIIGQGFIRQG